MSDNNRKKPYKKSNHHDDDEDIDDDTAYETRDNNARSNRGGRRRRQVEPCITPRNQNHEEEFISSLDTQDQRACTGISSAAAAADGMTPSVTAVSLSPSSTVQTASAMPLSPSSSSSLRIDISSTLFSQFPFSRLLSSSSPSIHHQGDPSNHRRNRHKNHKQDDTTTATRTHTMRSMERQLQVLLSLIALSSISFLYFVLPCMALVSLLVLGLTSTVFTYMAQTYLRHLWNTHQISIYPLLPRWMQRFITCSLLDLYTHGPSNTTTMMNQYGHLLLYSIPGLNRQQRQEFIQRLPPLQRNMHLQPGALLHMILPSEIIQLLSPPPITTTTTITTTQEQEPREGGRRSRQRRQLSFTSTPSSSLTSSPIHRRHRQSTSSTSTSSSSSSTTSSRHRMPVIIEGRQVIYQNNEDLYLEEDEEDDDNNGEEEEEEEEEQHNSIMENYTPPRNTTSLSSSSRTITSRPIFMINNTYNNPNHHEMNGSSSITTMDHDDGTTAILVDAFTTMTQTFSTMAWNSITQLSHDIVERISTFMIPSGLYMSSISLIGLGIRYGIQRRNDIYHTMGSNSTRRIFFHSLFPTTVSTSSSSSSSSSSTLLSTTSQGEDNSIIPIDDHDIRGRDISITSSRWDSIVVYGLYSGVIFGGISAGTMWWIRNQFRSKVCRNRLKDLKETKD